MGRCIRVSVDDLPIGIRRMYQNCNTDKPIRPICLLQKQIYGDIYTIIHGNVSIFRLVEGVWALVDGVSEEEYNLNGVEVPEDRPKEGMDV